MVWWELNKKTVNNHEKSRTKSLLPQYVVYTFVLVTLIPLETTSTAHIAFRLAILFVLARGTSSTWHLRIWFFTTCLVFIFWLISTQPKQMTQYLDPFVSLSFGEKKAKRLDFWPMLLPVSPWQHLAGSPVIGFPVVCALGPRIILKHVHYLTCQIDSLRISHKSQFQKLEPSRNIQDHPGSVVYLVGTTQFCFAAHHSAYTVSLGGCKLASVGTCHRNSGYLDPRCEKLSTYAHTIWKSGSKLMKHIQHPYKTPFLGKFDSPNLPC